MSNARAICCSTTGSPGRPLSRFSSADVSNTTMLLLSEDQNTLYVGSRDAVLALDVSQREAITMKNKVGMLIITGLGLGCTIRDVISIHIHVNSKYIEFLEVKYIVLHVTNSNTHM